MQTTITAPACQPRSGRYAAAMAAACRKYEERSALKRVLRRFAGGHVSNAELAFLLGVSKGQASKMVGRHADLVTRQKIGKRVFIGLVS